MDILAVLSDQFEPVSEIGCLLFLRSSQLTPLGKGSGSVGFEMLALREVAIEVEMVADIGMDGGEFLQVAHAAKPHHRPLSSPERLVRILRPVVEMSSGEMPICCTDLAQSGRVGSQQIGDDFFRQAVAPDHFLEKFQSCLSIPLPAHIDFENLTFVIDGAPHIVLYAVDLHEDLVQMPAPLWSTVKSGNPFAADFAGKDGTEPLPPEAYRFVADVDAAFMQQILDISKRQREADIHHHRQADDFRDGFEVTERIGPGHPFWLRADQETVKLL